MKILVACEFTGTVRRAFQARGHDVWSCDLLPALDRSNRHIQADVRTILNDGWDLLAVMHPPCTRLCNSGVRWLTEPPTKLTSQHYTPSEIQAYKLMNREQRLAFMWMKLDEGADFFSTLWNAPIPRKCIENPVMHPHAMKRIKNYRPPSQTFQPHQFAETADEFETKRICLWLRNLNPLVPTHSSLDAARAALGLPPDAKPNNRVHAASPGPERWAERSKFFPGVSNQMAIQWADDIRYRMETAA